jgi:ribosomal protein S18 acetylase RimI-like enzyme
LRWVAALGSLKGLISLRTCTTDDTDLLVQALNECLYNGYRFRVVMTQERFQEDARVHHVDLACSVLAFDGDRPVGVSLVARRDRMAWIGGMGIHPKYRSQGLGTKVLARAQNEMREAGVRRVLLEVLVENDVARRCYRRAGFVGLRRYYCFRGTANRVPWRGPACRVVPLRPAAVLDQYDSLHQAEACWQRDYVSLREREEQLLGLAALRRREVVATLLYSESAISDVGWHPASAELDRPLHDLLVAAFGPARPFAIVNVPDDGPLFPVMQQGGYEVYAEQIDMRCDL